MAIASDLLIYVDDLRTTGADNKLCWWVSRQAGSLFNSCGVQDARRKQSEESQEPGPLAGSMVHMSVGEVCGLISQDKWVKTRAYVDWVATSLR